MKSKILLITFTVIISITATTAKAQAVNTTDSLALVDLYNNTNGPNWYSHDNWLTGPVSTWAHVQLDGERVTAIYLSNDNLTGELSASIGNLEKLQELYLDHNNLKGPLPAELGNLHGLFDFIAKNNRFHGHIPESFGGLTSLYTLDLSHNQLTGPIPLSFYKIPIQTLFLYNNHLKESRNIPYNGQTYKFTATIDLHHNDFNFNGLEFITQALNSYSKFYSVPQAHLDLQQVGNSLSVDAGGTLSNNTYTWYKTGVSSFTTITGDSSFSPATNGMYYAQVTNAIVKKLTLFTDTITYTAPLAANKLSVYPNPVRSAVTINGLDAKAINKITVSDYTGIVWFSFISNHQLSVSYEVSKLKPGNYLVNVNDGNKTSTVKFVKE